MRWAIRLLGFSVLALALALAGFDAAASLARGEPRVTKVGDVWSAVHQNSLLLLQPAIERHVEPYVGDWLWDPVMLSILTAPSWLALGVIGALLVVLGRWRKPAMEAARR